jgi:hypothetical protein
LAFDFAFMFDFDGLEMGAIAFGFSDLISTTGLAGLPLFAGDVFTAGLLFTSVVFEPVELETLLGFGFGPGFFAPGLFFAPGGRPRLPVLTFTSAPNMSWRLGIFAFLPRDESTRCNI